ncbi:unnamed protein product [Urochloa humidicola]
MRLAGILTVLLVLGASPPCHGAAAAAAASHNITDILAAYPNFTEFSAALTSTGAAAEINRHRTITVLAVDNAAMAQLKAQKLQPRDLERVAYLHALLDYLDADKLRHIQDGTQETSLFQAAGKAQAGEGMVKIAVSGGGRVAFSLSSGGATAAIFQKSIKEVPSDIAVLQVSAPIWSPAPVAAAPPPAALAPPPAPAPGPRSSASPAPAPATAPAHAPPPAPAPASSPAADAPTPALAPAVAPAPAIPPTPRRRPAPAPEADTPAASPDADGDPAADDQKSNGGRDTVSWSLGMAVAAAVPVIVLLLW